ncbi:MAG: hypothetical protein IPM33_06325 [Phycisphaerales bacterium]|nr:hypothetical protein [Phycisphaerales bacterium]
MRPITLTALALTGITAVLPAAHADDVAIVNLTGVQIRNNRNESRSSAPDTVDPGPRYHIRFADNTTAHGVGGVLGLLFPSPTPLAQIMETLSPGSSAALNSVADNPSETHPFTSDPITQSGSSTFFGVTFTFGLTITTGIAADNTAFFSLTNVTLTSSSILLPPGYLLFDSGSVSVTRVCPADFNASGGAPDDADVAEFFTAWSSGDPSADFNLSGGTPDDADVAAFFHRWSLGC